MLFRSIAAAIILPNTRSCAILLIAVTVLALIVGAARGVRRALVVIAPIAVLLFVLQVLLGAAPRAAAPWGGTYSVPGLAWASSQGVRFAIIAVASLGFATLFDPFRFLQASIDRRWPFAAGLVVVTTLDAARQLARQATRLREAQRARGLHVAGTIRQRAASVPALVFPLLLVSLTDTDVRALALETRGLTIDGPRCATNAPRDTLIDRAVRWLVGLGVAALVVWRIR